MSESEISFESREQMLEEALASFEYIEDAFAPTAVTTPGLYYYAAYKYGHEVHKWATEDGSRTFVMDLTNIPEEHGIRTKLNPGQSDLSDPDLKYIGKVSREEGLDGALAWLSEHKDDEQAEEVDDFESIHGILNTERGPVLVTGIGASIFGNHIRAMQERGTANYHSFSGD